MDSSGKLKGIKPIVQKDEKKGNIKVLEVKETLASKEVELREVVGEEEEILT